MHLMGFWQAMLQVINSREVAIMAELISGENNVAENEKFHASEGKAPDHLCLQLKVTQRFLLFMRKNAKKKVSILCQNILTTLYRFFI